MPQICYFYGITIYLQYLDHNPPHIHVVYQGFKGQYEISSGRLLAGRMPNKADALIREWVQLRKNELDQIWNLAKKGEQVFPLSPLE